MHKTPFFHRTSKILSILSAFFLLSAESVWAVSAVYNPADGSVDIPAVDVGDVTYTARLVLSDPAAFIFQLADAAPLNGTVSEPHVTFDAATGQVTFPSVQVGDTVFRVVMQLLAGNGPVRFSLALADSAAILGGTGLISSYRNHACVITLAGGVKCWGENNYGQLGIGNNFDKPLTAVDVNGLSSGIIAVATGERHSCALTNTGTVKCWGSNGNGEVGDGTTTQRNSPVDVQNLQGIKFIAAGDFHTCAITTEGDIKCWGKNTYGQLGNGTTTSSSTPVDVVNLGGKAKLLEVADRSTCAVFDNGALQCWGRDNQNGSTPEDVSITGVSAVKQISLGWFAGHTCIVTLDGSAKCWGENGESQVGGGPDLGNYVSEVTNVIGLSTGIKELHASSTSGYPHTCALTDTGGVKCWGNNTFGQLGIGSTGGESPTPMDVLGLTSGVKAISVGKNYSCALLDDYNVKCWGGVVSVGATNLVGNGTWNGSNTSTDVIGIQ